MDRQQRRPDVHLTELGDRVIARWRAPTVESVKRSLIDHHFDPQGQTARSLVLEVRAKIEKHVREAWACGAVVVSGESAIRTGCGCRYCEEWGPIAEIELPIEQVDPATREQPARGFVVAVARVPAEDLYRTTSKLREAYDIVKKAHRTRRVTSDERDA